MAQKNLIFKQHLDTTPGPDGKRHYKTLDGKIYPSVTTVLSSYSKEGIQKWRDSIGHTEANRIMVKAGNLGTGVHALCEKYIMEEPFPPKINPFELERFKDIKTVLDERVGECWVCESALSSDRLKMAGRTDLIGEFDNIASVIDFKTSRKEKKIQYLDSYIAQMAIYGVMFSEIVVKEGLDRKYIPRQVINIFTTEHIGNQVFVTPMNKAVLTMKKVLDSVGHIYNL